MILIIIPVSFADDSSDYYFNSNVDDEGNGTVENPYKEFSNDKISDNSIVHFCEGNYSFTNSSEYYNITFKGENSSKTILNGRGYTLTVKNFTAFENITLTNFKIINEGCLNSTNTTFSSLIPVTENYDNSYGGAIYAKLNNIIYLNNCTFINNNAAYAGVIYAVGGDLIVENSRFIQNYADLFGGAIVGESLNIKINNTNFTNNTAQNDAGGTFYLINSNLTANCMTVLNSSGTFGGSIVSLNSNLNLSECYFKNNKAIWDGGVIYQMYGVISVYNSKFIENNALNGASLYLDDLTNSSILLSEFINNTASNYAGAIYTLFVNDSFQNNTFLNNQAQNFNDIYNTSSINIVFGNGNYTLYIYNQTMNDTLPAYYNLRDYGYVTSPKDQQSGGNCWDFAAISSLESCILKASGKVLDLSEENIKNLMALFSDYGYSSRYPNDGGNNRLAIGYLTSWMGPVFESQDSYDDKSAISPIFNSTMHVQNIAYLKRSNYTDNDAIKRAIMDYGAVATIMYFEYPLHRNSDGKIFHYYNNETIITNHAVAIIGWDDSFNIPNAEGNGAWIVKNSWGPNWMHEGYFYVSYYDTCFAAPNTFSSYVFILNDTKKFDKNYQYDVSGYTDFLFVENNTIWVKNKFISSDNEFLEAVSTYFEKNTTFQLEIKVNNKLQLTQVGSSDTGYFTINLDKSIPLLKGDLFEVIFKLTVDGDVGFAIAEEMSLNKMTYSSDLSFISFDGENWIDLCNFTWEYPGHYYLSQVAAIKAFTQFKTLSSTINAIDIVYDSLDIFNITVTLIDDDGEYIGNGIVEFNINGNNVTGDVYLGKCTVQSSLIVGVNNVSVDFSSPNYYSSNNFTTFNVTPVNLNLTVSIMQDFNNALINFTLSQKVNETLIINNNSYDTIDGNYLLNLTNLDYGEHKLNATLDSDFYRASKIFSFFCNVKKTFIEVNDLDTIYNSGDYLEVKLKDEFNQSLSNKVINVFINGKLYSNTTNYDGIALIKINLVDSIYDVICSFDGDELYFGSKNTSSINVLSSIRLPTITTYTLNSLYTVNLVNKSGELLNNTNVSFYINNIEYKVISNNGIASLKIPLKSGNVVIGVMNHQTKEIKYQIISILDRITQNKDISLYFGAKYTYKVRVLSNNGKYLSGINVTFTVNGVKYIKTTDNKSYAYLSINNYKIGKYTINIEYNGYKVTNKIIIKSTLTANNLKVKKGKVIKFKAKLVNSKGNLLKNKIIKFKFKGKIYKVKTNKKGIANLKIKNKYSSGNYKIYSIYGKVKIVNKIKIK